MTSYLTRGEFTWQQAERAVRHAAPYASRSQRNRDQSRSLDPRRAGDLSRCEHGETPLGRQARQGRTKAATKRRWRWRTREAKVQAARGAMSGERGPSDGVNKQDTCIAKLWRRNGARIPEMMSATSCQTTNEAYSFERVDLRSPALKCCGRGRRRRPLRTEGEPMPGLLGRSFGHCFRVCQSRDPGNISFDAQ